MQTPETTTPTKRAAKAAAVTNAPKLKAKAPRTDTKVLPTPKRAREKAAMTPPTPKQAGGAGARMIALLSRPEGATMADMTKATGWAPHSVRAFISAGLKKRGITTVSTKDDGAERVYRIVPAETEEAV